MEQVMLDMIPTGAKAVCHVSQYDIGRTIRFNLRSGGAAYTLSGTETVKVYIKKPDGTTAERNIANTSSTYVDWVTGEGDCDQAGKCECELVITSGTTVIGSKNFTVKIEEDPYNDQGVVTETAGPAVIATFTTNIVDLLQEVKCEINATGGNGTPDSPIPINGYTEANITANGNTYTISFGQTVYGGVLDVTRGKLTVTHGSVDLSDTSKFNFTYDNISKRWQSPFSDIKVFAQRSADVLAEQWQADTTATAGNENKFFTVGGALYFYTSDNVNKTAGNLVYPLKTPFDIDLTPVQIEALLGVNNVWHDGNGNTEVKYLYNA